MSIKKNIPFITHIVLIFGAFVGIFPTFFAFFTSFKTNSEFYMNIWALPEKIRIENYINAFRIGRIGEYFVNSIIIAVFSLAATIVLAAVAAYALARLNLPGAELMIVILIAVQILPTESMIIPVYMILAKLGLLGVPYLPIILPYIGWMLPCSIIIMTNFFKTIPVELLEAARIDGSSEFNTMIKVVIPLMKSVLTTCLVLEFCFVWGELMWAQIATLTTEIGIPVTVGLLNFQGAFTTDWGMMTAGICMIMIPLYALFMFTQKYFIAGLTAGGVKG